MGEKMKVRKLLGFAASSLFVAAVMFVMGTASAAKAQSCDGSDDRIVAEIYAKIDNDKELARQRPHIVVVSKAGVVRLIGWTDDKRSYDKVVNIAAGVKCVVLLNVNMFDEAPPPADSPLRSSNGCAPGTKPCGDVCIPENDKCSLN